MDVYVDRQLITPRKTNTIAGRFAQLPHPPPQPPPHPPPLPQLLLPQPLPQLPPDELDLGLSSVSMDRTENGSAPKPNTAANKATSWPAPRLIRFARTLRRRNNARSCDSSRTPRAFGPC